jgi:sigma-B regulation protein RsbU (phosphoserine phosphatase)
MILWIGLPTLVVYVAVLGAALLHLRARALEQVNSEMTRLANQVAARFDAAFREAAAVAATTARFMEHAPPPDVEQIYAQLEANTLSNPAIYGAAMAFEPPAPAAAHDLVCPYVHRTDEGLARLNIGRDVYDWHSDPRWQWWHLPRKARHGTWCDPYFDEGAGDVLMVTYSEPFRRDGKFAGVNTVDIMLPTLKQSLGDGILGDLDFIIVTKSGMFVFSPNVKDIMKRTIFDEAAALGRPELADLGQRLVAGESGVMAVDGWHTNERQLVFHAPIKSTGWSLAARMPEREAFASADAQARIATLALGGALALIIGCILLASSRITRPIVQLRAKVQEITAGRLEARIDEVTSRDEIGDLAHSFNQMTADLRENLERLAQEHAAREKLERDLDLAREIQRGLLPRSTPSIPGFSMAGWNLAADQTGGDYFDWLALEDRRVVFTLADVAGHGIGPALLVSVCRAYMRASASSINVQLADAVRRVNDLMHDDMPDGRFITAAVGILDPTRSEVTLVSAGQAPLLFYQARAGSVTQWDADNLPLGVVPGMTVGPPRVIPFESGDMLVLVTDGFFEWNSVNGERFGTRGLREFVSRHHALAPEAFIQRLHEEYVTSTSDAAQADDLTAVVLKKL